MDKILRGRLLAPAALACALLVIHAATGRTVPALNDQGVVEWGSFPRGLAPGDAQVPSGLTGPSVSALIHSDNGLSNPDGIPLPQILTSDSTGTQVLPFYSDGSAVSTDAHSIPSGPLTRSLIGLGEVTHAVAALDSSFGGAWDAIRLAGLVPGFVGLYQIDFTAPFTQLVAQSPVVANSSTSGNQFYAAPKGKATAAGTQADPWDLQTALSQPAAVKPGDLIWVRGGTYDGHYSSTLSGTASRPIVVRAYPGERATIDGRSGAGGITLNIFGSYAWYWGLEVMNSSPNRTSPAAGSDGLNGWGIWVNGPNTKVINCVIHDTDQGISFWIPAVNAELAGNIIYNNGWQGPDRAHGHGIYTQNLNGTKHIGDNIIFNQFELGIQAYGSSNSSVKGYLTDYNILFNNGSISAGPNLVDNILFGYGGPLERIRVQNNYTYDTPAAASGYSRIGWTFGGPNKDAVVTDNYWIGGYYSVSLSYWDSLTFTNNTTVSVTQQIGMDLGTGQTTSPYVWDHNKYFGFNQFAFNGKAVQWPTWRSSTHVDANSQYSNTLPTGIWTFVHPNAYEPGRANVAIYNWDLKNFVTVDLGTLLKPGTAYEIRDAENFFGPVVSSGVYNGRSVSIPMTGLTVAAPIGRVPTAPKHTAPAFGAFIVIPI